MVQVTNFLLKWLFLCRLVDDRAEVQTWPYRRPGYYEHTNPNPNPGQPQQQIEHQQYQQQHGQQHGQQQPPPPPHPPHTTPPTITEIEPDEDIPSYRESCIRSLTSHPPGSTERMQTLDELRLQAVQDFANRLIHADEVIRWGALRGYGNNNDGNTNGNTNGNTGSNGGQYRNTNAAIDYRDDNKENRLGLGTSSHYNNNNSKHTNNNKGMMYDDSHYLDADESIQNDIMTFLQQEHQAEPKLNARKRWQFLHGNQDDIHSESTTHNNYNPSSTSTSSTISSSSIHNPLQGLTPQQIQHRITSAHKLLTETREFLPQLVSTVLHSPPALNLHHNQDDPISSLRSLLIHRCQIDPSLGIELCWLLEAEVGRKWKALFEHRQQTGKRLILIVQADIAQAIATIGAEKASAFNLLQDAEMATAFGTEREMQHQHHQQQQQHQQQHSHQHQHNHMTASKPPRSISDLRCRHFGDSMHFVDRLTQISLDLRHVPIIHRRSHLQGRLHELNQRLCRRMISRGKISIDVENLEDDDEEGLRSHPSFPHTAFGHHAIPSRWSEGNIREDMIRHSVHFVMEPQCVRWPGGQCADSGITGGGIGSGSSMDGGGLISDFEHPQKRNGVVRALRILPDQCRVLDSRERCPFLVRMEVAETGLDANDARLYAMDVDGVALTVEEALGSTRPYGNSILGDGVMVEGGFTPCEIPPELMGDGKPTYHDASNSASRGMHYDQKKDGSFTSAPAATSGGASTSSPSRDPMAYSPGNAEQKAVLSRGGYQGEDAGFYSASDMYGDYNTYEMIREQHYEQVHNELQVRRENEFQPSFNGIPMATTSGSQALSMGSNLLDRIFGKPWSAECESVRQQSPFRNVEGWRLASFIIKAGEDIRKEALVMQIMSKLWTWFQEEIPPHLRPFLRPYTIMCTGGDAGLVECLPDVKSVNEVKKETDGFTTLLNFFERAFGPPVQPPLRPDQPHHHHRGTVSFEKARDNFLRSLVGYSVVCYILQIKDRHNANILMDREGHIMHIDFGFVLGETPKMGKVPLFSERAPFKLSAEFWEVIGGWSAFKRFCEMFEAAYAVAAGHSDEICSLVEAAIVNVSRNSDLARTIADSVRGRLRMKADPKEQKLHIMNIVNDAITSWGTSTYDWLQRSMNGYQ